MVTYYFEALEKNSKRMFSGIITKQNIVEAKLDLEKVIKFKCFHLKPFNLVFLNIKHQEGETRFKTFIQEMVVITSEPTKKQ